MRGRPGSDVRAYFAAQPQSPLTRQPVHRDRVDPGPPRQLANVSVARREQVVAGRIDNAAVMAGDVIGEDLAVLVRILTVAASSSPISRKYPATSALRIAVNLRLASAKPIITLSMLG